VRDHVNEGDDLFVKVVNIDERDRIRLSLKAVTEEERAAAEDMVDADG